MSVSRRNSIPNRGRYTASKYLAAAVVFALSTAAASAADEGKTQTMPKISVADQGSTYQVTEVTSATKTATPILDIPQSISVVTSEQIQDQQMLSIADVVRYLPGITAHQGENNRDQIIIRGNNSSADFFRDGIRDDVQYYRDLYNVERIEALKGPNAMIFGRGGGGGVVNRVMKEAIFTPVHELTLMAGSYDDMRATVDVNQPIGEITAVRLNATYEESDSFRNGVDDMRRYGINPTVTIQPGSNTKITLGYEGFRDDRTADRGIPSYHGRPADVDVATYYGNPDDTYVAALVNIGTALIEHSFGDVNVRNRTLYGDYDRSYQNYVPGVVNDIPGAVAPTAATTVTLTAYNNATQRENIFNQTDVTFAFDTGSVKHVFLSGAEFGNQTTDNFRNTGFFNNTATSFLAPYSSPQITAPPVTFRQSATDANNHVVTKVSAVYAQDQIELTTRWLVIAGVRFDKFDLEYTDKRSPARFDRVDDLTSPRAGLVFKPVATASLYGSYSVSYLPSSGDQFSSLTVITDQLKPEKFTNYEVGAKWDVRPNVSLTSAVYQLDRTNTRSTDPNDPTRIIQTGSQRTKGAELGLSGNVTRDWTVIVGYAYQDAYITSATAAAAKGKKVAQVPHNSFSLWNTYQIVPKLSVGLGLVQRDDMYAAVDNTVVLPGYVRVDAAAYFSFTDKIRLQLNVQNVLDETYYANADNNNNISPGSPLAYRVGLVAGF